MSKLMGNDVFLDFLRAGIHLVGSRLFRRSESCADDSSQKGQVLILTALAGVALVGFLALAVDVGNLYFVRRSAQNAADAAALVGAQDKQGLMPNITLVQPSAVQDARRYAISNGFTTDSGSNNHTLNGEVRVDVPPATGPYAGKPDYIEVNIKRQVNSLFAGVLGVNRVEVSARAVARAKQIGIDAATISLYDGDPSTVVNGGAVIGIQGNSYSRGVTQNMAGGLTVNGVAFAGGGFQGTVSATQGLVTGNVTLNDPGWPACPYDSTPHSSWNSGGNVEKQTLDAYGYEWIDPGTYDYISISSGDKVKFRPGVFHVTRNQGININGTAISAGPNCFVLDAGSGFSAQGGGTIALYSGDVYNNILIWSADTGTNSVKIAGSSSMLPGFGSPFQGTIYSPYGTVRLAGSSAGTVRGQVVAYKIYLEGGNGTAVIYDPTKVPGTPRPALME